MYERGLLKWIIALLFAGLLAAKAGTKETKRLYPNFKSVITALDFASCFSSAMLSGISAMISSSFLRSTKGLSGEVNIV